MRAFSASGQTKDAEDAVRGGSSFTSRRLKEGRKDAFNLQACTNFSRDILAKSYLGGKELDFLSPIFHSGIGFCTPLSTPVQLQGAKFNLPKLL
jgi:hypothetical protein